MPPRRSSRTSTKSVSLSDKIRRWRIHRSGLAGSGFQTPDEVAIALLGVQAQDNVASLISIWNRLEGGALACDTGAGSTLTESDIVSAGRNLVKIWGQRGTLHAYHIDDWPLIVGCVSDVLHAHCLDRVSDPDLVRDRVRHVADQLLANSAEFAYTDRHDPTTSRSIRMLLTLGGYGAWPLGRGRVNRITNMRPRQAWTSTPWQPHAVPDAVRRAALRYFGAYGPATEPDFRYMMGLRSAVSRNAVMELLNCGDLQTVDDDMLLPTSLIQEWDKYQGTDPIPLRMLYVFDPVVLAHQRKTWLIPDEFRPRVWTKNGIIHGVVLVDGRIVGKWAMTKQGRDAVRFGIDMFQDSVDETAVQAQLAGIAQCLQITSFEIEWE